MKYFTQYNHYVKLYTLSGLIRTELIPIVGMMQYMPILEANAYTYMEIC